MIRVGIGYDIHRLEDGRTLRLGGVTIPHSKGLAGHSDADALCHAITDALLGACALGNIGQLFPDSDPAYKDADSLELLKEAHRRVREAGYKIVNVDSNVIAQEPKLNPHIDAMRASLAECLELDAGLISVKAKTNEQVGPEGRGEAIRTEAIVLVESTD